MIKSLFLISILITGIIFSPILDVYADNSDIEPKKEHEKRIKEKAKSKEPKKEHEKRIEERAKNMKDYPILTMIGNSESSPKEKTSYQINMEIKQNQIKQKLLTLKEFNEQKKLFEEKQKEYAETNQKNMKKNADILSVDESLKLQEDMYKQALSQKKFEEKWMKSISKSKSNSDSINDKIEKFKNQQPKTSKKYVENEVKESDKKKEHQKRIEERAKNQ